MDFFKSGLKTVLGTSSSDEGYDDPTGADTVSKQIQNYNHNTKI